MTVNYYKILGIENKNASKADIRQAYIKLALSTHPDKGGNEEEFKKVNKAYEVLIDENKRREYDNGNENVSVKEYGYDYGDKIPDEGPAVTKYKGIHYDDYLKIYNFYVGNNNDEIVSDYHLVRAKKMLQIINTHYKPICEKIGWTRFKKEYIKLVDYASDSPLYWMSVFSSWDGAFNQLKNALNYARKKLELKELADSDLKLKIEGNPNETPQIPNEENKPIEDGVVDINEYNKLWYDKGHPDIAKYWKLRDEIFSTDEKVKKYSSANHTLYNEVFDKTSEAEKSQFRPIWEGDDANKISEIKRFNENKLAKMKKASELMEKLIAEGKKEKNPGSEVPNIPNDKVDEPKNNKRKAEMDIREENNKKSRTIGERLDRLIQESKNINDYQALEAKIKEIDREQGELEYENRQNDISQLKIKLGGLDIDKFKKLAVKKIEEVIRDNKIDDSDPEIKKELDKLKNENDVNKINQLSIEISEKVGKKGALNTLQDWLKRAKDLVEGVAKGTEKELREQLKKVQKGLQGFRLSTNSYQQSVLKEKENEVKQMLEKLENHSFSNNQIQKQDGKKSNFKPEIVIPVVILVAMAVAIGVIVARNRKRAQIKTKK